MTDSDLLSELIRIPSVNPDGDPGTDRVGEKACAEFTGQYLRQAGAEVRYDEVLPGRPNVVARFPADRPGKPRLLFAPHTDTVSVTGMTINPFGGEQHQGKIWGRGSSDTKGSMAAMLTALNNRRATLAGLSHEIWFAGLMGEEAGQHGSKALAGDLRFCRGGRTHQPADRPHPQRLDLAGSAHHGTRRAFVRPGKGRKCHR